jgi:hypothetical protein
LALTDAVRAGNFVGDADIPDNKLRVSSSDLPGSRGL